MKWVDASIPSVAPNHPLLRVAVPTYEHLFGEEDEFEEEEGEEEIRDVPGVQVPVTYQSATVWCSEGVKDVLMMGNLGECRTREAWKGAAQHYCEKRELTLQEYEVGEECVWLQPIN